MFKGALRGSKVHVFHLTLYKGFKTISQPSIYECSMMGKSSVFSVSVFFNMSLHSGVIRSPEEHWRNICRPNATIIIVHQAFSLPHHLCKCRFHHFDVSLRRYMSLFHVHIFSAHPHSFVGVIISIMFYINKHVKRLQNL